MRIQINLAFFFWVISMSKSGSIHHIYPGDKWLRYAQTIVFTIYLQQYHGTCQKTRYYGKSNFHPLEQAVLKT